MRVSSPGNDTAKRQPARSAGGARDNEMFDNSPFTADFPDVTALSSNFLDIFTTILKKNHYICYINLT